MPLLKNGKLVDDPWTHVADEVAIPASGPVMVAVHVSSCPGRSLETKRSHFTSSFMFDHGTVT